LFKIGSRKLSKLLKWNAYAIILTLIKIMIKKKCFHNFNKII